MRGLSWAGLFALVFSFEVFGRAPPPRRHDAHDDPPRATQLAPVDVPLPPPPPEEAPSERDPTGAISHVTVAEMPALQTADLLAALPGLVVHASGGLGQAQAFSVRGASAQQVKVLLDGIPLAGPGGLFDPSTVPLALISRIALDRGPAGARYGSGGLGGVLELFTPKPRSRFFATASMTGGSFGTALADVEATGPILGGEGLVSIQGQRSTGDFSFPFDPLPAIPGNPLETRVRANDRSGLGGALMRWRGALGGWRLGVLGDFTSLARGLAGPAENPTPRSHEATRRTLAGVRLTRDFQDGAGLSLRLHFHHAHSDFTGSFFGTGVSQAFTTGGLEASAHALFGTNALTGTVDVGFDSLSVGDTRPDDLRLSAMAVDDWLLFGRLTVSPSLRVDRVGHFTGISPKLGAALRLTSHLAIRANVGLAFRAPSFEELYLRQGTLMPNPDLQPERARSADVALTGRFGQQDENPRGAFSVGAFRSDYLDLIRYERYSAMLARPYNFTGARVVGLEAEGRVSPLPWLSARASYALTFSRNLRDDPRWYGKVLPYTPRHQLDLRARGGPGWLFGFAELLYRSEQFTNRAQTLNIPASALVDLGVQARLRRAPEVVLRVELKNALDAHTEGFDGYPLPGRAAYATVRVSLGANASHSPKEE